MRGKKLGYQIGAEKIFPVELEMVSQEVDLVGEEDARDRAAVAAVFARPEILFEILVDKPLPGSCSKSKPAARETSVDGL